MVIVALNFAVQCCGGGTTANSNPSRGDRGPHWRLLPHPVHRHDHHLRVLLLLLGFALHHPCHHRGFQCEILVELPRPACISTDHWINHALFSDTVTVTEACDTVRMSIFCVKNMY